ncbi:putative general amidase [Aaosphaeria arxii CBS 175.79]|uniref:amidase n=1 Tax=Aaosphaeria arxii CBS 175.79 TaxID=1450172 RepID=A0A6A5XP09_9PLEO|nr:putative general amidase [Aaosphaeria arxii CBS 175.79]KAF2014673.1 putative general amidase [Aaosphaeria arxii CBS 175.79]
MSAQPQETWQEIAARKQSALCKKLFKDGWQSMRLTFETERPLAGNILPMINSCEHLSPRDIEITEAQDATELLSKIHSGQWPAREVLVAFYKRALVAHRFVNCLMDADLDAALNRAQELDNYLRTTGNVVGPLHGLPVSIKDLTDVKGLNYSMGYVSWADNVSADDAVVVETLRKAGAVIYLKTTMPQTGMALETFSRLWGRTLNPHNVGLVAGGSSGGEGALIASRGSLLGMGTDSGGSIRIPAAYNGLYSIKPTSRRVSYRGNNNNASGLGVSSSIGPMAHSLRDLKLAMKTLIDDSHWLKDPMIIHKPWDYQAKSPAKLRIGVLMSDGLTTPHPPIQRALQATIAKLTAAGHQVVTLEHVKLHMDSDTMTRRVYGQVGSGYMLDEFKKTGEPPIDAIKHRLGWETMSLEEMIQVQISMNYTAIFNILDYPAVTIPTTFVDKTIDRKITRDTFLNAHDKENWEMYDPEVFHGMPVVLQLVGLPSMDGQLLEVAAKIDDINHRIKG